MSDPIDASIAAVFEDSAADETAIEAAVPETEDAPVEAPDDSADDLPVATDEPDDAEEPATEPEPIVAETPSVPAVQPEPVQPNWDSDANPYYVRQRQAEELRQAILARQQQDAQAKRIAELADDDPARITEFHNVIQQNIAPYVENIGRLTGEVEVAAKLATVYDEAAKARLDPETYQQLQNEVGRLMQIGHSPDAVRLDIETRKADRAAADAREAKLRQENAELKRQLAARSQVKDRAARKADVVGSSPGHTGTSARERFDAATSYDAAIDAILDDLPGARAA